MSAFVVSLIIYTLGYYIYLIGWLPRGRLHDVGLLIWLGRASSIAVIGALTLLGIGLVVYVGSLFLAFEPPKYLVYMVLTSFVLLVFSVIFLSAIIA